jgi:hypothetical protein
MAMHQDEAAARSEMLIRDAEDDLQKERLQAFWRAWGSTIIGMAVMLVVGTGAGVAWREWRESRNEQSTAALLSVLESPAAAMDEKTAAHMDENQAAIAWLSRAETAKPEELAKIYGSAAEAGDNSTWGWLARWNSLRLRMDNASEDPEKLIQSYESLAADKKNSPLSALAWADAAIIAGERMKDPGKALEFIARAEKIVPRATPMSAIISDLKHLYEIRARANSDAPADKENAS